MKKQSKYGLRSGNTFHFGTHKVYDRLLRHNAFCILKTVDCSRRFGTDECTRLQAACEGFLDDGGMILSSQSNFRWGQVEYSMNKRKRWDLPQILTQVIDDLRDARSEMNDGEVPSDSNISSGHFETALNFDIAMVERVLIPKGNNYSGLNNSCIAYHDSRYSKSHVSSRKAFSFMRDLREKAEDREPEKYEKSKRARAKRRRRGFPNENSETPQTTEDSRPRVLYEICRPAKLLPLSYWTYQDDYYFRTAIPCSKRCKNIKGHYRKHYNYVKDSVKWGQEELIARECCDMEDEHLSYVENLCDSEYEYDLQAAVELAACQENSVKSRKRKRKKVSSVKNNNVEMTANRLFKSRYGKGESIYLDENPRDDSTQSGDNDESDYEFLDHVAPEIYRPKVTSCLSLVRRETTDTELQQSFGTRYSEGMCLPRSFMIDVGALLCDRYCSTENDKTPVNKMGLLLIFEELCSTYSHDSTKTYSCHVESGLSLGEMQLIQSFINLYGSVSPPVRLTDLICHVLNCIENHPNMLNAVVSQVTLMAGWPAGVWRFGDFSSQSLAVHEADQVLDFNVKGAECRFAEPLLSRTVSQVGHLDYCDICYVNLLSETGEQTVLQGVAMVTCGHWYCKQCWQSHLVTRIRRGDTNIKCPSFDCDVSVSNVVMTMLLPYCYYRQHRGHVITAALESHGSWQWCPNTKCGRLARIMPSSGAGVDMAPVRCGCGQTWCYSCREEVHWPANCKLAHSYSRLRQQLTLSNLVQDASFICFVEVKKCPSCKHPMEKSGGCQHMRCCRCHHEFCWECLTDWREHLTGSLVCPDKKKELQRVDLETEDDLHTDIYILKQAMIYRAMRHKALRLNPQNRIRALIFKNKRGERKWRIFEEEVDVKHMQAWSFMLEGLFLLEQVHVVISTCRRRRRVTLITEIQRFILVISKLYDVYVIGSRDISDLGPDILTTVTSGGLCACDVIRRTQAAMMACR